MMTTTVWPNYFTSLNNYLAHVFSPGSYCFFLWQLGKKKKKRTERPLRVTERVFLKTHKAWSSSWLCSRKTKTEQESRGNKNQEQEKVGLL